jgi:hypothetical protein
MSIRVYRILLYKILTFKKKKYISDTPFNIISKAPNFEFDSFIETGYIQVCMMDETIHSNFR